MSNRKLAHVERIIDLQPIPGADRIEVATVLGWKCVVKKGEVKVGDLVVYIEIDSIVPKTKYFEFMEPRRYRVRTVKLKGQVSQGLIVPCKYYENNDFCELPLNVLIGDGVVLGAEAACSYYREGDDVTDVLHIVKYESESDKESNSGESQSNKKKYSVFTKFMTRFEWYRKLTKTKSKSFPDWISKTDEERIQNIPNIPSVFRQLDKKSIYITEKLDSQSSTYFVKRNFLFREFGICSRTVRKFEFDNSNWSKTAALHGIKRKLMKVGKDIAIQGEIIGPGIQGNKYRLRYFDFYVFNVYDIKTKQYYNLFDMEVFCKEYGFKMVPVLYVGDNKFDSVDSVIEYSKGHSVIEPEQEREGVVIRTVDQSVSFKGINPDFLLGEKE